MKTKKKIFVITMILAVVAISTVNVYLAKPDMKFDLLSLSNIGLTQASGETSGDGIPIGGCCQEIVNDYMQYEDTEGNITWNKKTTTYSCFQDTSIRYCQVGTVVYYCITTWNCNLFNLK
jgi:hypothetical protein